MKKIIALCLFIATTHILKAQVKPTKYETVTYINKTLQTSVGFKTYIYNSDGDRYFEHTIQSCSFLVNELTVNYNSKYLKSNESSLRTEIYSKIPWETLLEFTPEPVSPVVLYDNDLIRISARFSTNLRYNQKSNGKELEIGDSHYTKIIYFYVLKTKEESFKKALKRLAEIAIEENKDPFEN